MEWPELRVNDGSGGLIQGSGLVNIFFHSHYEKDEVVGLSVSEVNGAFPLDLLDNVEETDFDSKGVFYEGDISKSGFPRDEWIWVRMNYRLNHDDDYYWEVEFYPVVEGGVSEQNP